MRVCLFRSKTRWRYFSLFLLFVAIISTKTFGSHLLVKNVLHIESLVISSTNLLSKCSTAKKKWAIYHTNTREWRGIFSLVEDQLPLLPACRRLLFPFPRVTKEIGDVCTQAITLEVTGRCRHCKQLCGGMEIPYCDTFSCSRKATINCLRDLLTKKVERREM